MRGTNAIPPFTHPIMFTESLLSNAALRDRPEDWRVWPPNDPGLRPMRTGLGEILPLMTNGILVLGYLGDKEFVCHITNVPVVEKPVFAYTKKNSGPKKVRECKITISVTEDDLL